MAAGSMTKGAETMTDTMKTILNTHTGADPYKYQLLGRLESDWKNLKNS